VGAGGRNDPSLYAHINNKRKKKNWAKDLNIYFTKKNILMANKHMKRC
jgi:hypothetical protein